MTWRDIISRWHLVVCDLAEKHGIDEYDREMWSRPWPWLRRRIIGLLHTDSRLVQSLTAG